RKNGTRKYRAVGSSTGRAADIEQPPGATTQTATLELYSTTTLQGSGSGAGAGAAVDGSGGGAGGVQQEMLLFGESMGVEELQAVRWNLLANRRYETAGVVRF
ncbi:unnamed protein product, partial [Pylaiella littoralis]